jgi:hypothetical protein
MMMCVRMSVSNYMQKSYSSLNDIKELVTAPRLVMLPST